MPRSRVAGRRPRYRSCVSGLESWAERWTDLAVVAQGIGTLLASLVAVIAVVYARHQVRLARDLREEQARPFVIIEFRPSHSVVCNIVIRNLGTTVARNVRFRFEPEWESSDTQRNRVRESQLWRNGIPTLVPGQEVSILADMFPERFKRSDLPRTYDVTIAYEGVIPRPRAGRRRSKAATYEVTYTLDLDIFYGYSSAGIYGVHEVADALRSITNVMQNWSEHRHGPLSVVMRDGDAHDAEELAEIEASRAGSSRAASTPPTRRRAGGAPRTEHVPAHDKDTVRVDDAGSRFSATVPIDRPPSVTADRHGDDPEDPHHRAESDG